MNYIRGQVGGWVGADMLRSADDFSFHFMWILLMLFTPVALFSPCSLFWKLLLAYPQIPATARPLAIRCHVSRSCCLWIHEWRGGQKQDEVADHVPASRQDPHLTQPIWFRDKAPFQTWLWRVDKRRDLGDYTWRETFFRFHVVRALDVFFVRPWNRGIFLSMHYFVGHWVNSWQAPSQVTLTSGESP